MSYSRSYKPTGFYRATGFSSPYAKGGFLPPSQYWAQVNAAKKGAAIAIAQVSRKKAPAKKAPAKKKRTITKAVHEPHTTHKHAPTHANSGIGRSIGEMAGGMIPIAGPIAEKALGWLGDKLEDGIGSLFGFGEYKVESNSLMENGGNVVAEGGRPPQVSNAFEHDGSSVIIRHQEPLGDIVTSATPGEFKLQNFNIQPGLASTFPWLAALAGNFQQYRLLGALYEFRSMAADAISGTNIALGTVTMATNYNSSEPNFTSKKAMQNTEYSTSTKPSLSVFHPIECDPKVTAQEVLYIRTGAVPDGDDQRLYDWGNFQIATSGFQGAEVTIGELWVTYEIALIKPTAVSTVGTYILAAHMQSNGSSGVTAATPFQGATMISGSTLGVYVSGGGTTLNLSRESGLSVGQKFKIDCYFAGTATGTQSATTATANGCTLLNAFNNVVGNRAQNPSNGAVTQNSCYSYVIRIDSLNFDPTLQLNAGTIPTGVVTSDVYITQIPANMN